MGLCNACVLARMKLEAKRQGRELRKISDSWYYVGEQPEAGQGPPFEDEEGRPVRFAAWFMAEAHSYDEDCRSLPDVED